MSATYSSYSYNENPGNEYIIITRSRALKALHFFRNNLTPEQAFGAFQKVTELGR